MIQIATEKTYTIKEISKMIDVPTQTIKNSVRKNFPNLMINGSTTRLNEQEVSVISKQLKVAHNSNLSSTGQVAMTELEETEVVVNAMRILNRKVQSLQPKAEKYDLLMDVKNNIDVEKFAKSVGIGRNTMFKQLRDIGLLISGSSKNIPYQRYIEQGIFEVIQTVKNEQSFSKTLITPKGINYIINKLKLTLNKQTTFAPSVVNIKSF